MFIDAESLIFPSYLSSFASSFRESRLLSNESNFNKSTIEVRQRNSSLVLLLSSSKISATSTSIIGPYEEADAVSG